MPDRRPPPALICCARREHSAPGMGSSSRTGSSSAATRREGMPRWRCCGNSKPITPTSSRSQPAPRWPAPTICPASPPPTSFPALPNPTPITSSICWALTKTFTSSRPASPASWRHLTTPPCRRSSTATLPAANQHQHAARWQPGGDLKPEYLAAFRSNPRHPLRLALQDNDVYYWKPRAPLHLYHCAADRDVIIANSEVALATFQSLGATQVQLFDPLPSADHSGCSIPSLAAAKAWFDSLR